MEPSEFVLDEPIAWPENPAMDAIPKSFEDFSSQILPLLDDNLSVSHVLMDKESEEYGALQFNLGQKTCLFRQAKTTPKKVGQFVTIWKREHEGAEIAPFEEEDDVDFVVVAVHDLQHQGFFIFSKDMLVKKRVFTAGQKEGKRAIRVYAPWVTPTVKQAISTQKWQLTQFVSANSDTPQHRHRINTLFKQERSMSLF
ncbi:MepB family protein [Vibrio nigripulchritudo]|uniref:MepB family protein n=1 Tax=Vibrio nigripulchritudo TaxID=28173 RepID=UPI00068BE6B3|nr:MepB family protein [Vibrio nigripulchritudo]